MTTHLVILLVLIMHSGAVSCLPNMLVMPFNMGSSTGFIMLVLLGPIMLVMLDMDVPKGLHYVILLMLNQQITVLLLFIMHNGAASCLPTVLLMIFYLPVMLSMSLFDRVLPFVVYKPTLNIDHIDILQTIYNLVDTVDHPLL